MSIAELIYKNKDEKDNVVKTKVEVDDTWIDLKKEEESEEASVNIKNDR